MTLQAQLQAAAGRRVADAQRLLTAVVVDLSNGKTFSDAELADIDQAARLLNRPVAEMDELAALYRDLPALRAAVAALPSDEQHQANRAELERQLVEAEGSLAKLNLAHNASANDIRAVAELKGRLSHFDLARTATKRRLADAEARLAPVLRAYPVEAPAAAPAAAPAPAAPPEPPKDGPKKKAPATK